MKIENDLLAVDVATKGAELQSIIRKKDNKEVLWQGHRSVWARRAPILFPTVGGLKNDTYFIDQDAYNLPRHGFARDMEFEVAKWGPNEVQLRLRSSPETYGNYPFDFTLIVGYRLEEDQLIQSLLIQNDGSQDLPCSIGLHPAFNVNDIAQAKLEIEPLVDLDSDTIDQSGLRLNKRRPGFQNGVLALDQSSFDLDAFIFDSTNVFQVRLLDAGEQVVFMRFEGFPYLGIWAKPGAPFVCIEPWCGVADKHDHNQQLFQKEGIHVLFPSQELKREVVMQF